MWKHLKKLILKYEQHKEYLESQKTTNNNSVLPQRRKAVIDEDEDYFNESDDEDKVLPLDSINGKDEKSKTEEKPETSEFKRRKINSEETIEDLDNSIDKKLDNNPSKRLKLHK